MKFIKIKSVEILTNGSLNFKSASFMTPRQTFFYKKDHKTLEFVQRQKNILKFEVANNDYKTQFKF